MTKILNRMTACLLAMIVLVSYTPLSTAAAEMESLYGNAQDDFIIEDAAVIDDASEVWAEEEFESSVPEVDESPAPSPEESAFEDEAGELFDEETVTEETSGTEACAEEFKGIYNVTVIWPDGASNRIELQYFGSDRADVADNISVIVAEELNTFDVHESEYTCVPTWNRKKSRTEKAAVKNDAGIELQR